MPHPDSRVHSALVEVDSRLEYVLLRVRGDCHMHRADNIALFTNLFNFSEETINYYT